MSELTKEELKWINKVQRALNSCPSDRIAFYTIGDCDIVAYNHKQIDEIYAYQDIGNHDFCAAVNAVDADFNESLIFKNAVESTAG